MDKMSYVDFIGYYQNEDTIKVIGKIDLELLKSNRIESLYYSFPLIEKMVLEIFSLVPEADIEQIEQGIMRTIMAIIKENEELEVLPRYAIEIIEKYFGDNGVRNRLFHVRDTEIEVQIVFNEINFLIMKLLKILKNKLNEYKDFEFKHILKIN